MAPSPTAVSAATVDLTDTELVQRARAGAFDALETLATRYEKQVYALAWRMLRQPQDAEDVVQQTFLSVLENLSSFREEASFRTWLMRIATHAALKIIRKQRGLPMVPLEPDPEPNSEEGPIPHPQFIADWREAPHELAALDETRQLLDAALNELDEKHRLVFILRDVQQLSVKETALALGLSDANVKVRLLRARLALRERLTQAFGDRAQRLEPHRH